MELQNQNPLWGLEEQDGRICFAYPSTLQILKWYLPLANEHCLARNRLTCVTKNIDRLHTSQRQEVPLNV